MSESVLQIGLSSWIIQDGNYGDFECHAIERFALEFYSEKGLYAGSGPVPDPSKRWAL